MRSTITDRILVPIASEEDAEQTFAALQRHFEDEIRGERRTVIAVHIIEKTSGAPTEAPLGARREEARDIFDLVEASVEPATYDVETRLEHGTDAVEAIRETVVAVDATSIVFLPRKSGFFVRFLTDGTIRRLVPEATVPVITLPTVEGTRA